MPTAIHLDGGNYFDDMRINIQAAHEQQDEWLKQVQKRTVRKPLPVNYTQLAKFVLLRKLGLYETFVNNGSETVKQPVKAEIFVPTVKVGIGNIVLS